MLAGRRSALNTQGLNKDLCHAKGEKVYISIFDGGRALKTETLCLCLWLLGQSLIYGLSKKELFCRFQGRWRAHQSIILLF